MSAAIIAVLGTLAGAILTGTLAHLTQLSQRAATEAATRRTEAPDAVAALADHRRAMWLREDLRLRGEHWTTARATSHITRAAITAPLLRLSILAPALASAAQTATTATYALRHAPDNTILQAAHEHAIRTTDTFVATAGTILAA
ncbi:protein kilB [Streptomyces sp. NBC_01433]|uniref:protein kilB n=1 Tax=Streptomyces sp. NBC_01433 TaxID=2903864 RepID=UPI00224F80B4|nr:protein kilB [Streptomyces sp. NBC_01433]MCX4682000.1 protein kilB [Streptomyces sp. NBC_01433]